MQNSNNKNINFIKNTTDNNRRNKIFWGIFFVCITILSVIAITSFNQNFSFTQFFSFVKSASLGWIMLAFCSLIFFILCEGWSITSICSSFGFSSNHKNSFFYSAADIYFSAITPSASGGQPATAYFMLKDGISIPIITLSLLYTLLMYSLSIILLAFFGFILNPSLLFQFDFIAKVFIFVGFLVQLGLLFLFYCFLYKPLFLNKVCQFFLKILFKLRIVHDEDSKIKRLSEIMESYQRSALLLRGKRKVIVKVLFLNIIQRIFQIGVIVFAFLATGGKLQDALSIFSIETFVIMGAYSVPIPGAVGVTDYLMINGFQKVMSPLAATNLELFSRGLSFYFCILICGIAVIIKYFLIKRSSKNDRNL